MTVSNNDLLKDSMVVKFDKVTERQRMDHNNKVSNINNKIVKLTSLRNDILKVKNESNVESLKFHERIDGLSIKNNMERTLDLTMNGIPESIGNLKSTIYKISSVINFEDEKSIVNIYRLNSTSTQQVSMTTIENKNVKILPIVINFATKQSRHLFHSKYFAFIKTDPLKLSHIGIDSDSRIFVNENLSKHCLVLLKKAKQLKKAGKIAGAYSYDGHVCVYRHEMDKKFEILSNIHDFKKYE